MCIKLHEPTARTNPGGDCGSHLSFEDKGIWISESGKTHVMPRIVITTINHLHIRDDFRGLAFVTLT